MRRYAAALPPVVGVVQPATLFHRLDEIEAEARATDAAVKLNLQPSDWTRGQWEPWLVDWRKFSDNQRSSMNLLNPVAWLAQSDDAARGAEARHGQLTQLRAQYRTQLSRQGGPPPPIEGPTAPELPPDGSASHFPVATVAVVVGIVAVAGVLLAFAPEIKVALRGAR